MGWALPWDFGIVQDYDYLLDHRCAREVPFAVWPDLWRRLRSRRSAMISYRHPPHVLGLCPPDARQDRDMDAGSTISSEATRVPPGLPLSSTSSVVGDVDSLLDDEDQGASIHALVAPADDDVPLPMSLRGGSSSAGAWLGEL